MTVKQLLGASILWTLIMAVAGVLMAWYMSERVRFARDAAQQAKQLGETVGTITGIGYGLIWLPYAYKVGQRRRAEAKAPVKKKKRRR